MKTVIHHIELSHTSPNLSGGEKAMIEIIKYIANNTDYEQIVYTSESGQDLHNRLIGTVKNEIKFVTIGSIWLEQKNEIVAYLMRNIQLFTILRRFSQDRKNIIFTHEEFLPSALYSYILKLLNPSAKWIAFFHMKSPSIFKGFEGEYTGKKRLPNIKILRYKVEQLMFFGLTKYKIDNVITVNPIYKNYLKKRYENLYALKRFGGEPVTVVESYSGVNTKEPQTDKEYDLCFMGRFHVQKGLFELIEIVSLVKLHKPDVKLAILGGGNDKISRDFFEEVKSRGLSKNIIYKGFISSNEKFDVIKSSRIFVFPSYYESFGQSALEAMACGIPVVAYDLPPFIVFKKGMIKVPVLNNKRFVKEIMKLYDEAYYKSKSLEAQTFAKTFSWDKTSREVLNVIQKI